MNSPLTIIRPSYAFIFVAVAIFSGGCMSFRSEMEGPTAAKPAAGITAARHSVLFLFTHLEQEKGFDVVPKIVRPRRGFRDIFAESMKELSGVRTFATFTDSDNDIDDVARRSIRDSLRSANDFTIHLKFKKENYFSSYVLGNIISYGTLATVPVPFSWDYIVTADIFNSNGVLIKSYSQTSTLTTWYHMLLIFAYPFLPSEVKIEEIYLESLQNIFRQIEQDSVLAR